MILGPAAKTLGYPRTPDADPTKPYVMWAGTPYEHVMIPVKSLRRCRDRERPARAADRLAAVGRLEHAAEPVLADSGRDARPRRPSARVGRHDGRRMTAPALESEPIVPSTPITAPSRPPIAVVSSVSDTRVVGLATLIRSSGTAI